MTRKFLGEDDDSSFVAALKAGVRGFESLLVEGSFFLGHGGSWVVESG